MSFQNSLVSCMVMAPKDWSLDKSDAWIYGIICGWNRESYDNLSAKHGWSEEDIARNIALHSDFNRAKT